MTQFYVSNDSMPVMTQRCVSNDVMILCVMTCNDVYVMTQYVCNDVIINECNDVMICQ